MSTIAATTVPSKEADGQSPHKKLRPRKYLPTARISPKKQLQLIRSYGLIYAQKAQPITNKEAGETAGLTESTAALLNAFFVETGLLAKQGQAFVPSEDVVAFAHAFDPETAAEKLAPLLSQTWFATALLPRLRLSQRDQKEALGVLAEACSATGEYRENLAVLLDYLDAAAVIERSGGIVRVGKLGMTGDRQVATDHQKPHAESGEKANATPPAVSALSTNFRSDPTEGVVRFNISVEVGTSEFSGWQPERIAAFFSGMAQVLAAKGNLEKGQAGG